MPRPERLWRDCPRCGGKKAIKSLYADVCRKCWVERGETGGTDTRKNEQDDGAPAPRGYEWAWAEWLKAIKATKERYAGPQRRPVRIGRQRLVIASDFHVPFVDRDALAAMLEREKDADTLIVAGDIHDFYSVSRFLKYEDVPVEQELAELTVVMGQLSEVFPRVILLEGNHGKPRFEKQLRERLTGDMIKVVEFLAGGNLSVITALANRYPNIEVAKTQVGRHSVDWFAQVGDVLVAHAEKFSVVPGSALRKVEEWFADQEETLGLAPWKVVCQAHTHQLAWMPWHSDKLLIETGCLSGTHGYQLQARVGGRPQRRGWVTLEQTDGVTDIDSVKLHWWDAERSSEGS